MVVCCFSPLFSFKLLIIIVRFLFCNPVVFLFLVKLVIIIERFFAILWGMQFNLIMLLGIQLTQTAPTYLSPS